MQHVRYTKAMLINSSLSHCYQGEMTLPISYGFLVALLKCNALNKKKHLFAQNNEKVCPV